MSAALLVLGGLGVAMPGAARGPGAANAPRAASAASAAQAASAGTAASAAASAASGAQARNGQIDINGKDAAALAAALLEIEGIDAERAEAIVKGRPYRNTEELVARKILPRAVYQRIKARLAAGKP